MSHLVRMTAIALLISGCGGGNDPGDDAGMDAAVPVDSGGGDRDAGPDAGLAEDTGIPGVDAGGPLDGGPVCAGSIFGRCDDPALSCLCCPAGGPTQRCVCSTECTSAADCTDSARPMCDQANAGATGICAAALTCAWGGVCAAPDTPIATPDGERPIAELREGDLVYSVHEGALVAVPIERVSSTRVVDHAVVRVRLANGRTLDVSARHPTADGHTFGDLAPGGSLDGVSVLEVEMVPYMHDATYDILPASDTGTYVAGGVLIGTTLGR